MTDLDRCKMDILRDNEWRHSGRGSWGMDHQVIEDVKSAQTWDQLLRACPGNWKWRVKHRTPFTREEIVDAIREHKEDNEEARRSSPPTSDFSPATGPGLGTGLGLAGHAP
jgi:hypothetical protein